MKPLVVILGPTAVGKTNLSIELAVRLNGEIISADSMQIYKHMDIGTAKPTLQERKGIKHYLIDEVEPDGEFSVAKYKELAQKYIESILAKQMMPILVGGTGLYIDSVVKNIQFSETVCDWEFRRKHKELVEIKGSEYLHDMLEKVDPVTAQRLHVNDTRRVIRALEVYEYTKLPISKHQEVSLQNPSPYNTTIIGLTMDRELLYERVNKRVDTMLEQGLVDEVVNLKQMGYTKDMASMKGLGYKEIMEYLDGDITYEEAVEMLKRDTRRYAKRQLTWFRRNKDIHWIDVTDSNIEKIFENSIIYIAQNGII